jgi:type III secretion system YscI/HrpB-like protein
MTLPATVMQTFLNYLDPSVNQVNDKSVSKFKTLMENSYLDEDFATNPSAAIENLREINNETLNTDLISKVTGVTVSAINKLVNMQ